MITNLLYFILIIEEILGSCCGIRLSNLHGYLGMYVVRQDCRGIGIGKEIWNVAIEHLGTRNKGLSAVNELFHVYRDKAGFTHIADWTVDLYKLERMSKLYKYFGEQNPFKSAEKILSQRKIQVNISKKSKLRTVPFNETLISKVIHYDNRLHSYDRSKIIHLTLNEKNNRTRVALLGETVVGYGCIKPNLQNLWMIMPLYADCEYVAKMLLSDLIGSLSMLELDQGVVLKSPSNNFHAKNLLKKFGFVKQTYSLKRCYTKSVIDVPTKTIFALHTSVFCTE